MIRHKMRTAVAAVAATAAAAGIAAIPAHAITGGTSDTANKYSSVVLLLWYEGTSRYRCTGSLIEQDLILTAGHCTEAPKGQTLVIFDQHPDLLLPRAADHDTSTGNSNTGFPQSGFLTPGDALPDGMVNPNPGHEGTSQWTMVTGTAVTHPKYSNFTDLANWNDVGVVKLDAPAPASYEPMNVAPLGTLNDYKQPLLNKTLFRSIGYGTHVQKPDNGPQKPVAESNPLERQYADQPGQKLTPQILQMNGNINDTRGTGGTCFGDSGGPSIIKGKLALGIVTVTSYGRTDNCRYLGGYQRVDIKVVQDWLETQGWNR